MSEAYYIVTSRAPFYEVYYDPVRGYYILHPDMLDRFLDSMRAAGTKMIPLDEKDVVGSLLPNRNKTPPSQGGALS